MDKYINEDTFDRLIELILPFIGKVILGIVILIIGRWLIRKLDKIVCRYLSKNLDRNIVPFLSKMISIGFNIILIITILSTLGVETTSFAALIGSVGVAFGFALSGSLQNIASALIIFIFKPFSVGDVIKVNDFTGKVDSIKIFNTVIQKFDKTYVFIPNNILTTNEVINFSIDPIRREEITVGVGYGDDIKKAKKIIEETLNSLEFVLEEPGIKVGVSELADSSVNFTCYYYVNRGDHATSKLNTYEPIKYALEKAGIEIPFQQIDVHQR